jgi:holo-[acyl-carrier protein] synthase
VSVLGVGLDLVEVARLAAAVERHGERFERRVCRPGEVRERTGAGRMQHLAGLFAAKEAVLKALGTGWAQGLGFRDVEVVGGPGGRPEVRLHDAAAARARELGVAAVHLSITHERGFAAAVAVLSASVAGAAPAAPTAPPPADGGG